MTKEDIAECIKVMQAYVEGKQIQYVDSETEDWADIESPIWNWDTYDYRIKPEPEYRPFKDADECWQADAETSAVRMDKENLCTL